MFHPPSLPLFLFSFSFFHLLFSLHFFLPSFCFFPPLSAYAKHGDSIRLLCWEIMKSPWLYFSFFDPLSLLLWATGHCCLFTWVWNIGREWSNQLVYVPPLWLNPVVFWDFVKCTTSCLIFRSTSSLNKREGHRLYPVSPISLMWLQRLLWGRARTTGMGILAVRILTSLLTGWEGRMWKELLAFCVPLC